MEKLDKAEADSQKIVKEKKASPTFKRNDESKDVHEKVSHKS